MTRYGEDGIKRLVSDAGEGWRFGIEEGEVEGFLSRFGMKLIGHKNAKELEKDYFTGKDGRAAGRVNGTHCLVTAGV